MVGEDQLGGAGVEEGQEQLMAFRLPPPPHLKTSQPTQHNNSYYLSEIFLKPFLNKKHLKF